MNFLGIIGSLRKDSYNRMLFKAFGQVLPEGVNLNEAEIADLPLYNQDLEDDFPKSADKLKKAIEQADGIIFFTPEFNRTIPAPLKNAVDWFSRPYGKNSIAGKPVLVLGATVGNIGTALSQYNLKQALLYLDARVLGQPEFYLSAAQEKFSADGELTDEATKERLKKAIDTFVDFVKSNRS